MSNLRFPSFIVVFFLFSFLFLPVTYAHTQVAVVEITEEGFLPDSLTIDQDQTIIFVNKDQIAHWPASDPHPTHTQFSEFDPQMPIESGKSWTFKPKRVGEWKYHDHLNPHQNGKILVTSEGGSQVVEAEDQTNKFSKWIKSLKSALNKYLTKLKGPTISAYNLDSASFAKSSPKEQITSLEKFADSNGAESTWQFIKTTFKNQVGSSGNIHDLAHLSGSLLFEKTGFDGIGKCSPEFAFGCYHGFLDKAFTKNLDHLLDAQKACLKLGNGNPSGPAASCIHGIGHGVASYHSVKDLKSALASCRKLTLGKEYCFDGVFMEFVRSAPDTFYKKDDLLYPCNNLEKNFGYMYSLACGRNQPSMLLSRFKMGFEEVVQVCLTSDSKPFQQACFDSLGFSLASTGDVDQITTGCQSIGIEEYVVSCQKSAAGELIFQEAPGWQHKSPQICSSLKGGYSSECFQYLEQLKKQYNRQ